MQPPSRRERKAANIEKLKIRNLERELKRKEKALVTRRGGVVALCSCSATATTRKRSRPMSRNVLTWIAAGGVTAAILYLGMRPRRGGEHSGADSPHGSRNAVRDADARNSALKYRPVGASGEPYPDWVRALDGKSGVYILPRPRRTARPRPCMSANHTQVACIKR
jgi:hypothetical protein